MKQFINTTCFLSVLLSQVLFSQGPGFSEYQYISPIPGSTLNQPETNIIIRYGAPYNPNNFYNKQVLEVKGERSGLHAGKLILAENNRTILFNPDFPFAEGERVTVKQIRAFKTVDDNVLPELSFDFRITEKNLNKLIRNDAKKYFLQRIKKEFPPSLSAPSNQNDFILAKTVNDSLPEDFPDITVSEYNNPAKGEIFFTPFTSTSFQPTYLIITDNYGVPIFYRKMTSLTFDFKKQINGMLTYFDNGQFYVLDSSYNIVDSLYMKNGYIADLHELVVLENGHSFMMCYDNQQVGMDTVVPGGNPNAVVTGLVIQELDENKNVIFQWRSWDHFKITDATYEIDLTDSLIDYVHGNAIELDNDGNLLISCRHMDEITKINRQTGDIIWRWGGEYCENNQFTFINDPIGFSHQHDVRRLPNGNITLFDNGNLHDPQFSRAVEYQLDEVNKYAQLISDYRNNPQSYSPAMGSNRRLENHNTFIGWGWAVNPAMIEVKFDGTVALSLSISDTMLNYRAFKFPWKTNLFAGNPEYLYFGYVPLGDSLVLSLEIINNSNQQIEINDIYNRDSVYQTNAALPIIIPAFDSETISVKFKPVSEGDYFDDLHLRWNKQNERIAQLIPMIGSTDPDFTSVETETGKTDYHLSQNYPNPFNPMTNFEFRIADFGFVSLKVYDILGREISTLINEEKSAGTYKISFDASSLPSGIYFYRLQAGSYVETKKMVLLR